MTYKDKDNVDEKQSGMQFDHETKSYSKNDPPLKDHPPWYVAANDEFQKLLK